MRIRRALIASAAVAAALPVLAQDRATAPTQPAPAANAVAPEGQPGPAAGNEPAASAQARRAAAAAAEDQVGVVDAADIELPPPPPPVEYPAYARRDPGLVGSLDPVEAGFGPNPWGSVSGAFVAGLMQRMDAPVALRWAHIALRNALLARAAAPAMVNPVDWAAARAWLLLRMGEADAARLLVSGVDTDRFTTGMYQVGVQSALANADPAGLCPLEKGIAKVEPNILPLVEAMCSAMAGEPESAAAQIDRARRRGTLSGIDLVLAEKVVGAGADTGRAVTVEWEPVEKLNSWRFGLATATGMTLPDRLIKDAPTQLRAWQARAPMLAPQDRLASAEIATGLGVFSSQTMIDLYALIYDATGADDLPQTDAWQVRLAFVGKGDAAKLEAMRRLWGKQGAEPLKRMSSWALLSRAAARIAPRPDLQSDAPDLIASMLAAGLDRDAARWADAVRRMDGEAADRSWAMLAVGVADPSRVDISMGRINGFVGRDESAGRKRSALLIAGLLGLGRIDVDAANRLNRRYSLGLERQTRWTKLIDAAAGRGQSGTVAVLAGTGLQTSAAARIPSAHLLHLLSAFRRTGQDFTARMIAAEALART